MRLFIALPLPPEVASAAAALLPDLPGLRRLRPDLLHATLVFLGQTAEERVPDVVAACAESAAAQPQFAVTLDRAGCFPANGAPRVVWLGIGEGAAESAALATRIGSALTARGLRFDDRPFRPHVTLARVRDGVDRPTARAIAAAAQRLRVPALRFGAEAVVLCESVLSGKGPRHAARAVAPLGPAAPSGGNAA